MKLEEMTWPEALRVDRDRSVVLLPIAACEQHSHHLPTFTDTILCGNIAARVEASLPDQVLLLPTLWFGASEHHLPFGATVTVQAMTHVQLLAELLTPFLDDGFRRVMILNGHGGNKDTLRLALRTLQPKYQDRFLVGASYWEIAADELAALATEKRKDMGHACEFETSMVMHLRPDLVRKEKIQNDGHEYPHLKGLFVADDMSQKTERGCVGFPEAATPELGRKFFEAAVSEVTKAVKAVLAHEIVATRKQSL